MDGGEREFGGYAGWEQNELGGGVGLVWGKWEDELGAVLHTGVRRCWGTNQRMHVCIQVHTGAQSSNVSGTETHVPALNISMSHCELASTTRAPCTKSGGV